MWGSMNGSRRGRWVIFGFVFATPKALNALFSQSINTKMRNLIRGTSLTGAIIIAAFAIFKTRCALLGRINSWFQ